MPCSAPLRLVLSAAEEVGQLGIALAVGVDVGLQFLLSALRVPHKMAELTTLEEKLAEVLGLAQAAQGATEKVEGMVEDEESSPP